MCDFIRLKSTRKFTWLLLIGFVLQNAFTVLVGRYTRSGGNAHEIHHMLLVTEILKFGLSCGMEYINSNGKVYQSIKIHVIDKPWDCAKIGFPALLYYGQNYAISASFAFMSVLLFQMIFQWKLLATVVLSTFLLKRQYKVQQLICMVVLCIGVSILAMYDNDTMASLSSPLSSAMLVLYACLCSSVAGVYFEKILKENTGQEVSVWMRNMQLAWFSILISTAHALISSSPKPLLYGFTCWVWLQIFLLGIGGLLVAVVLKYTSAVTKALATNISIVISVFVASVIWRSQLLTFDFAVASAMVLSGVYVFNNPTQTRRFVLALAVWLVIRLINFEETIAIETDLLSSVEMHPLNDCNGTTSDCTLIYPDDWTLPDYHTRPVLPVSDLRPMFPAMFGLDYRPSLHRGPADGHPFLLLLMVQQPEWLGMAINFILSLRKLGIYNVTITSRDNDVLEAANALGLITFNSTEVSKQMPKWFKPLPSWTWGVDMWQRYVTSWHAIRQGIGTCHFDVDTAVSTDIFFDPPGGPYDITMQGNLLDPRMRPVPLKPEKYLKRCNFQYRILGSANYEKFYVNQGYACYAANERTFEFFRAWDKANKAAIRKRKNGWLQPASNKAFCDGDITISKTDSPDILTTTSARYGNMSSLVFRAFPDGSKDIWDPSQIPPAVHPKGCHGGGMGNIFWRVQCKIDVLNATGLWHIPFDVPFEGNKWKDPSLVAQLRTLLDNTMLSK